MAKSLYALILIFAAVTAMGSGTPKAMHASTQRKTDASPSVSPDPRIVVYIFAFSTPTPKVKLSMTDAEAATALATSIGKLSIYRACHSGMTDCSADQAAIFIHGFMKSDGTVEAQAATFSDSTGFRSLGSLAVANTAGLSQLTYKDLTPLLGNAVVDGGRLTVAPGGYQEFLQLVPGTVSESDPDYASLLQFLLGQRGIRAFRSQMTLGAVGDNSGAQSCTQGQEYLVYSLAFNSLPHKLIGTTRLQMNVYGALLNCNATSDHLAFSGEASKNIPTLKSSLLSYTSLLATGFTKLGWTSINLGIGTASGIADTEPTSVDARAAVAESALRNLVDNLCGALPSPSPNPKPPPTRNPPVAVTLAGAKVTAVFDPSTITGTEPYVPSCGPRPRPTRIPTPSPVTSMNSTNSAQGLVQNAAAAFSAGSPIP